VRSSGRVSARAPSAGRGENLPFPLFDQRGSSRPVNTYSNYFDIGAVEFGTNITISGQLKIGTNVLKGVSVNATNSSGGVVSAVTDVNGEFQFANLQPGTFTVAPQPLGVFNPTNRSVTVGPSALSINFSAQNAGVSALARFTNQIQANFTNQQAQLSFALIPNQSYRLQSSTNLVTWQSFATNNSGSSGAVSLVVTNSSTNFSKMFFRAVTP